MGDLTAVMVTVDRSPGQNYLRETLGNLIRSGAFKRDTLNSFIIFNSRSSGDFVIKTASWLSLSRNVRTPQCDLSANENIVNALIVGRGTGADWILLLEDDLDFCDDAIHSMRSWLYAHASQSVGMYTFGSACHEVRDCAIEGVSAWECPPHRFYGTQAVAIHTSKIQGFVDAIEEHSGESAFEGKYDLLMAEHCRRTGQKILAAAPSIVQHIGVESVIRPGSAPFQFRSWPGLGWRFGDPYLGKSQRIRLEDFQSPWYRGDRSRSHRKNWEHAIIAHLFERRYGAASRAKALGFGVGQEPLPAMLAHAGASVLATDQAPETAGAWVGGQHLSGGSPWVGICTEEEAGHIQFADLDMREIPSSLNGFDFTWSAGSFEHLGGIERGIEFFCKQMECLRPGGLAVHTTEYNFLSNEDTIDSADLCLFRLRDLVEIERRIEWQGDWLWPIDVRPGEMEGDNLILDHPYSGDPHLNIRIGSHYVTTSIVLVAEKGMR